MRKGNIKKDKKKGNKGQQINCKWTKRKGRRNHFRFVNDIFIVKVFSKKSAFFYETFKEDKDKDKEDLKKT